MTTDRPHRRPAASRGRAAALAAALGAALAGCPLPQTLPEFPGTGTTPPPRLRSDATTPGEAVTLVDPACAPAPAFALTSSLVYENTIEPVEARWFVDYAPSGFNSQPQVNPPESIPGPANGADTVRPVTPFTFRPNDYDPGADESAKQAFRAGGGLHVVELVISNNFAKEPGTPPHALPNRTPATGFETQVYRWTFHYQPGGGCQYPLP